MMLFDDISRDGRLWAVRYDGAAENALYMAFEQWGNVEWLRSFFVENKKDLDSYFKVTDVDEAIYDTLEDNDRLQCLILDLSPDANLDDLFKSLDNNQTAALMLDKEKARPERKRGHLSWLRLYAIRLDRGAFIITGGTIKLTHKMSERAHTLRELVKMEQVRNFLLEEGIVDKKGFQNYQDSQ